MTRFDESCFSSGTFEKNDGVAANSIATPSYSPTGSIKVARSWYPSDRLPIISKVRLIFAGVRIFMHRHPVQSSIPAKDKIIVPLDVATVEASRGLIDQIGGQIGFFKVGSQLFTATGPAIIDEIRASGSKIFLDLKFHAIPNTVRRAVESAC